MQVARRWLMAQGEKALPSADNTIEQFPLASPPSTPASTRYLFSGFEKWSCGRVHTVKWLPWIWRPWWISRKLCWSQVYRAVEILRLGSCLRGFWCLGFRVCSNMMCLCYGLRLERGGDSHEKQSLLSPQKQWSISSMWWGSPKDDQVAYQCILMPVVLSMLLFFNNFYSCACYLCAEYGLLCCRQRLYKGKYSHYVERLWVQKRGRPQC